MTPEEPTPIRHWLAPTLPDIFFLAIFVAVFAHPHGIQALLADGDTGWHIRTGDLVLATGRIPRSDPFSFSLPGRPWFAWEWLSDVVFALLNRWGGLAAVAAAAGAALALAATVLFGYLLRLGAGLWVALAAALAAASAASIHYLARPHVFSILLYTVAVAWIAGDLERPGRRVWLLVPLAALWANLHAGFVLLPATLVLAAVTAPAARRARYFTLSAATAIASLANPYGWRLDEHIWSYLRSPWILDHVQEFQSPSIRSEGSVVFVLLLLAGVALAPHARRFQMILVLVWAFAALRSARHIPFFAITAAPVVAVAAAAAWREFSSRRTRRSPDRILWDLGQDFGKRRNASIWLAISVLGAVALAARMDARFPDSRFPAGALEQNTSVLTNASTRVLTSDQWADYLIFRFYPRTHVFFDGRSDYYGQALGEDYRKLLGAGDGWREVLNRYRFSAALLPHDWPLSTMLDREPGWRQVYRDPVAVLFTREENLP